MRRVVVGKWGKNLAIRFPDEVVGLRDGERIEVEAHDGDIPIRRRLVPHFTLDKLSR